LLDGAEPKTLAAALFSWGEPKYSPPLAGRLSKKRIAPNPGFCMTNRLQTVRQLNNGISPSASKKGIRLARYLTAEIFISFLIYVLLVVGVNDQLLVYLLLLLHLKTIENNNKKNTKKY
jgi:hypothetical protein